MATGLQTFLPGAVGVQFTNEVPILSLFRQGSFSTSDGGWVQEGGNSGQRDFSVSIPESVGYNVMIALRSSQGCWAELVSRSGQTLNYRIFMVGSGTVQYFIYSDAPPPANPSRRGLELYHQGRRTYASDYQPMLPLGIFSGANVSGSYSGIPLSGRRVAHVPVKAYSFSQRSMSYAGQGSCNAGALPGWQVYQQESWTRSAIIAFSGSVSVNNRQMTYGPYPTYCSPALPQVQTNSTTYNGFRSLIIDVTTLT